jgi:hypothetical protein
MSFTSSRISPKIYACIDFFIIERSFRARHGYLFYTIRLLIYVSLERASNKHTYTQLCEEDCSGMLRHYRDNRYSFLKIVLLRQQ